MHDLDRKFHLEHYVQPCNFSGLAGDGHRLSTETWLLKDRIWQLVQEILFVAAEVLEEDHD